MSDDTRAELRRHVTELIAAYTAGGHLDTWVLEVGETPPPKPLTTAQQLALSVLLGDEAVLPQALADYLLDQGHEYATAVAEKARAEERERCRQICIIKAEPWDHLRQQAWDEGNIEVCDRAEGRAWMASNIADAIQKGITVGDDGELIDHTD